MTTPATSIIKPTTILSPFRRQNPPFPLTMTGGLNSNFTTSEVENQR